MRVVACYNIKGGVGKTATAVNLAYLSAATGARTLLWDMDPQGATSFYFRVKPKVKGGFHRLIRRKRDPRRAIRGTDFESLDLLPADFDARHIDVFLDRIKSPAKRMQRILKPLRKDYDRIILDCAPSVGIAAESIFRAADVLVVPSIPTTLSMNTLQQLEKTLKPTRAKQRPDVWPFFTMVDQRKMLHRRVCETVDSHPFDFLETRIPYSSHVERMGIYRAPVETYAHQSNAGRAYRQLSREIEQRLSTLGN